jgi:hypothetical protein
MIKVEMSDVDDLKDLMSADEYTEYLAQQKETDEEEGGGEEDE